MPRFSGTNREANAKLVAPRGAVAGTRYAAAQMSMLDSEKR